MSKPFSVLHWASHPDEDNDDCTEGEDFETAEAAIAYFKKDAGVYVRYIEIDGLEEYQLTLHGIERLRPNPNWSPIQQRLDGGEWQREQAMQAGMGGGCEAYNEAMGYD